MVYPQGRQRSKEYPRIGILGGSFDPIHCGHLKIAESACHTHDLGKVIFVPSYCPPHKSRPVLAPFEHRLAMVMLAIRHDPRFSATDIERGGCCPSYAGTTVRELQKRYGTKYTFFFITGLDALPTLTSWEKSRMLPGLCYFIGTPRPGFDRKAIEKQIPEAFLPYIIVNEMRTPAISSTRIKQLLRMHRSIHGLVPADVEKYITEFGVYTRCFT